MIMMMVVMMIIDHDDDGMMMINDIYYILPQPDIIAKMFFYFQINAFALEGFVKLYYFKGFFPTNLEI